MSDVKGTIFITLLQQVSSGTLVHHHDLTAIKIIMLRLKNAGWHYIIMALNSFFSFQKTFFGANSYMAPLLPKDLMYIVGFLVLCIP